MLGRQQENVRDLIASMRANGWLDIDPILVQRTETGRFLVVEGNRRVATLKYLQRRHEEGDIDLGRLDPGLFAELPVVLYRNTDERSRLVMMGLHHISGKRRWPAINRARAMERLLPHFGSDAQAVCEALGVTKREFNLSVRTLALVRAYEESDYGDQLQPDQYNLFREVLRSEDLRAWIGWDHDTRAASNRSNLNRLFSWMSNEVEFGEGGEEDQDGQDVDAPSMPDPAIATGGQVRELAKIIKDPPPFWLVEQLPSLARISGRFDEMPDNRTSVEFGVETAPETDVEDQTSFLRKLVIESSYGARAQHSDVAFFGDRPRRTRFEGQNWLCRSAFTSPFSANRPETLARCNKESIEAGTKPRLIDFIRERVDPGLRNIEMADRFNRFLVPHDDFKKAPDLAVFGEGMRRVFEIGLLFADVRGGVLLVDEFENAIHTRGCSWSSRGSCMTWQSSSTCRFSCRPTARRRSDVDRHRPKQPATRAVRGVSVECRGR